MPKAFLCPYFHHIRPASRSNPERVTCDGGVTRFKDAQMKRDTLLGYCALDYQKCTKYQLLTAYYERENQKRRE